MRHRFVALVSLAVLLLSLALPAIARADGVIIVDPPHCDPACPGPTYVGDTIHVEIEVTEIRPTSKDPLRALVRTTNDVKNQKGETVLIYTPLRMMQGH